MRTEGLTALSKSVNVTSNDPKQPLVTLVVTAVVQPEINLSEKTIYFGNVPRGREVSREIIVTLPADRAVKIVDAESTDSSVTARLEPIPDSDGRKLKLVAVQKADAKDGYHFGAIILKTTSARTPQIKIPVRGMIATSQPD